MNRITLLAGAKLNLTLEVLGTRPDGYHDLRTIMQSVTLSDTVTVRRANGLCVETDSAAAPGGPENLAYRAALRFFEATTLLPGAQIEITKRIPVAAGLAGGSADAAAVLRALCALYGVPLPMRDLVQIAASLGADVPFLLTGGAAGCTGIGDGLRPLPALPPCHILLAKLGRKASTAQIYREYDRRVAAGAPSLSGPFTPSRLLESALQNADLSQAARHLQNAFYDVISPVPARLVRTVMLQSGAAGAMMTGSGPTVFGLFARREKALLCAARLRALPGCELFLCHPSPRALRIVETE